MACTHNSRLYWTLEGWTSCPCGEAGCLTHYPINPDIYKNCTDSCFPDPTTQSLTRIFDTTSGFLGSTEAPTTIWTTFKTTLTDIPSSSASSGSTNVFLYYILPVVCFLILAGLIVAIYKKLKICQAPTPRITFGVLLTPDHHTTTDPELGRQAVETRVQDCMPPSSSQSAIEHCDHPHHHGGSASQDLDKVGNEGQEQIDLLSDASHDED